MRKLIVLLATAGIAFLFPRGAMAEHSPELVIENTDPLAIFCVIVFMLSYLLVMAEEKTLLRKSKPVMLGAGIIWVTIGIAAPGYGIEQEQLRQAIFHDLDEYGSLMLFLMAAMIYISALETFCVFGALRSRMVCMGLSFRQLFWATGIIAFFLSAVADNLTTALVMGAVVMAVGADNPRFVAIAMINIVCAANAGGAFSPFGDITTLMVWQSGRVEFIDFFVLFMPSVVTFAVPAVAMSFAVPAEQPASLEEHIVPRRGAKRGIVLGLITISMAVSFEYFLGIPPFMGMMTGLSLLMFLAYYLRLTRSEGEPDYNIFENVKAVEWDTLLFFFGVMFSVGGLAFIGYLELASSVMYGTWGPTVANISLGIASAVVDNIPVMFSVLSMRPDMPHFQWLLVTLTCGVGGSLLSIGSAAGVALMGASQGRYTFLSHLRWTPIITVGYAAGIGTHFLLNS